MNIELAIKIIGLATAVLVLLFTARKAYQLFRPIKVTPFICMPGGGSGRGAIGADVVNLSGEVQYIIKCSAIGTYPLKNIIFKHLKNPFTRPYLMKSIWYGVMSFPLLNDEKLKLNPYEHKKLEHYFADHPLSFFDTPLFLIEVQLSSGRKCYSKTMNVPPYWHFGSSIGKN